VCSSDLSPPAYPSGSASFHSKKQIAPSNRGIKQLAHLPDLLPDSAEFSAIRRKAVQGSIHRLKLRNPIVAELEAETQSPAV